MVYIRNWPEGLFILLVMICPLVAAIWLADGPLSMFAYVLGLTPVGLGLWIVVMWVLLRD